MKILLVSFPRYSTDTVNPGEELLKGVLDQDVTPLLLPLSWSRSQIALEKKNRRDPPRRGHRHESLPLPGFAHPRAIRLQ